MTEEQKNTIIALREEGVKFAEISARLNLPEGTIKTFCRRNKDLWDKNACCGCGKIIENTSSRKKRFCTRECYLNWWEKNQRKRTQYCCVCAKCGNEFIAQSKAEQKYCSRACFYAARKGGNRNG